MSSFKDYKEIGAKYGVGGEGNWMKLDEGDNKIRIVSEFDDYGEHFDEKLNRSFICLGKEKCEYCKEGVKPRVQFKGWVIDRKDNKIKLLTIGYKIHEQIGAFATSEEYGFETIPSYDITITKSGIGKATKYAVLPDRKDTPLTEEENKEVSKLQPVPEIIESIKERLLVDKIGEDGEEKIIPLNEEEKEVDVKDIPL